MPLQSVLTQLLPNGVVPAGQPGGAGGPGGPAPPGLGSGWEVKVLGAPDYYRQLAQFSTQILTSVQFVKQLNDKGSGTVTLSMDDAFWATTLPGGLAAHNILDYEHLWQVWQDGVLRFEFLGETVTEQLIDAGEMRIVTVTGPGSMAVLSWAMAMPPGFPNIIYKLDAISDGFSETDVNGNLVLDTNLWNQAQPLNRIALNPSGTAQVMASPGTTYLGTSVFDATETLVSANIRPMVSPNAAGASLNGSQLTQFYIQDVNNSANYALMGVSGTSFYCRFGSGTVSQTKVIASATQFNAASGTSGTYNYDYWMISEHAGSFFFWTSNDGQNWTQQWTVKHSWASKQVAFFFSAQYSVDNTQYATLTSLNSNVATSSLSGATYLTQPIMSVWLQTLKAAQARGTVPFVTTRMTATGDSYGNPWTDTQSVQIANGTDLFALLQGHTSMVNADYIMEPGFLLKVAIPHGGQITLGADRSQQVIFREARDETGKTRVRARNQIANVLGVVNADGRTVTTSDSTSIANWAQREGWLSAGVQVTEQDIAIVASASVQQTAGEQLAWTMTITPNQPGKTIFRDFAVGDWVGLERPDYSAVDAVRVIAIAVSVDQTGVETHELTLVSYIAWLQEQFNYVMQKMGGNLLSASGTTQIAGGITSRVTPTVFAPTLAGLGDVLAAGASGNAPLVYDPVTGKWVPAGTQNPDTGATAGMAVTGPSGTTTVTGGSTTVAAPSPAPADGSAPATPAPVASTTTTPQGHTIVDSTGTQRVVIGVQSDGTITARTLNTPPPATPSTPIVSAGMLGLIVGWDGQLGGTGPLADFKLVQVHSSTTSGFTPSNATLNGTMVAGGLFGIGGLTAGTTYYVRLVALSQSNTASAPSTQATGVPASVGTSITPGSLPGNVIQTGTITTTQISATAGILGSQLAAAAGITAGQVAFTASAIGGGPAVSVSSTAPSSPHTNDLWFDGTNGYTLKQWNGSTWVQFQYGTQAIAAGSITAAQIAANTITAAQIATGVITATQIAAGTITASQIAANTLTAGLFQAGIVIAGIINGTIVTGPTIQNSTTNPRTSINPDGSITITNAGGTVIFKIGPDGTIYWYTAAGQLNMELQPGGTQLIYASVTGPVGWDYEPPSQPAVIFTASSVVSSTTYTNTVGQTVFAGACVTVVASASGASAASAVTDSKGNTYTLLRSVTTNEYMQVFQCASTTAALTTSDTVTVTYPAANTQEKNIIGLYSANLIPTPVDFSASSNGSGTSVAVSGTPANYGDLLLLFVTDASAGGAPTAVPDGWTLLQQQQVAGNQWTSVYWSANVTGAAVAPSLTIVSAAWSAILVGLTGAPVVTAAAGSPTGQNATLSPTSVWSSDGGLALKVTHSNTTSGWGMTTPFFPVQAGSTASMQCMVDTPTALSALSIGFTFWSGTNGTGTNLGTVAGDQGTLALGAGAVTFLSITGASVPAGAQSATFFVSEGAADAVNTVFYVDSIQVPGGLVYSNSPVAGVDLLGNIVEQGINFIGLPGLTNVFGVEDPWGNQLLTIDGQGDVTGQTLSAVNDVVIAGSSLLTDILPNYSQGVVTRGWCTAAGNWPSTPVGTTETPILELDFIVPAGRAYMLQVLTATFIPTVSANTQMIQRLRYTTDGSNPTTSSTQVVNHSPGVQGVVVANSGQNMPTPYMEWLLPIPAVDTQYRMLLSSSIQAGSFVYALGSEALEMRVTDAGNNSPVNNGTMLGTGTGGGGTTVQPQNYTEVFYAANSYSYDQYGLKTHNGNMYQGCYIGNNYDDHTWFYFGNGSRGNSVATVLGYSVQSVTLRLLCLHSWYNSGMTVSLRYGNPGNPNSGGAGISGEITNWHLNEGQQVTHSLSSGQWGYFSTAGRWFVLRAGSLDASRYGYFYGAGGSSGSMPMLTVKYTH